MFSTNLEQANVSLWGINCGKPTTVHYIYNIYIFIILYYQYSIIYILSYIYIYPHTQCIIYVYYTVCSIYDMMTQGHSMHILFTLT